MIFEFEAEVRLLRWSESSTAGRTVTIELPPDAGEGHPFRGLPTGHQHGQRFIMKFSAIGDDEQPAAPAETKQKSETRSAAAKERYADASIMEQAHVRSIMLAKDQEFQRWTGYLTEESAAGFIRRVCGVSTRSDIATNDLAYERFLRMEGQFREDVGRTAEMRA